MALQSFTRTIFTVFPLILLAACSKPPGCADTETVTVMKSIVVDDLKQRIQSSAKEDFADDPKGIQASYFETLTMTVSNVVSDGYDEKAKKHSCHGKMAITTASNRTLSREVEYTSQATEDKGGGFVVSVDNFAPMIQAIGTDLRKHYLTKRYTGEWSGTYACDGIRGEVSGPQGPFSSNVTIVVDENQRAKLERTTLGGGIEISTGTFGRKVEMKGEGRNSPDDRWITYLDGTVQGYTLTGTSQILLDENQLLRVCAIKLASS